MLKSATISKSFFRKSGICLALTAMVILAFASSGGGGRKNKNSLDFNKDFAPVRTTGGFTMKAGPWYKGSQLLTIQKQKDFVLFNSIVTYQKGNVTYILPYKYKMSKPSGSRNNLDAVDIKIRLHK